MKLPVDELCALVAQAGVENASKLTASFEKQLEESSTITIDTRTHERVLLGLAFMNWGLANGVWSTLDNTKLRRDLMASSKNAIVLKVTRMLRRGQLPEDIAFMAASIDEQFHKFVRGYYIPRMNELERTGGSPDANAVLLIALEWIQNALGIPEAVMTRLVPSFLAESTDFAEIESVAEQVNRAVAERQKKGILRRFFR